jgi:hypothetical protein
MGSVSVEGLNLSAGCPGNVVVGAITTSRGTVDYSLVNTTDSEALVSSLVELIDSQGNSTTDSQTFIQVGAGGSQRIEHVLNLVASYDQPGDVVVTTKLSITGAVSLSDSTFCTFIVNE